MKKNEIWFELNVGVVVTLTKYFYNNSPFGTKGVRWCKREFTITEVVKNGDNVNVFFVDNERRCFGLWLDDFNKVSDDMPYCLICKEPNVESENLFRNVVTKRYNQFLYDTLKKIEPYQEDVKYYSDILKNLQDKVEEE